MMKNITAAKIIIATRSPLVNVRKLFITLFFAMSCEQ